MKMLPLSWVVLGAVALAGAAVAIHVLRAPASVAIAQGPDGVSLADATAACEVDAPIVLDASGEEAAEGNNGEGSLGPSIPPPRAQSVAFQVTAGTTISDITVLSAPDPCDLAALGGQTIIEFSDGSTVSGPGVGPVSQDGDTVTQVFVDPLTLLDPPPPTPSPEWLTDPDVSGRVHQAYCVDYQAPVAGVDQFCGALGDILEILAQREPAQ